MKNFETDFCSSLLFRWLHSKITVSNSTIQVHTLNTLLGLIPVGAQDESIPMSNISSVALSKHITFGSFFLGLFFVMIGLDGLSSSLFAALFWLIVGGLIVLNSFRTVMNIQRSGSNYLISVPTFTDASKLVAAQTAIQESLVYTEDKKDVTANTDRIIDAIHQK